MFEVAQFDSYAYLFQQPTFVSLAAEPQIPDFQVQGLRIGVNGAEAPTGQAFENLDSMVSAASYTPLGQRLSELGTIVPLEKGPESDEFFVTFEIIGNLTNVKVEASLPPPAEPADLDPSPVVGLRTFDDINLTMAKVTGMSRTLPEVAETYLAIKQQLPVSDDINGFLASHQVGVAQLAIEYCNALVEDTGARASYWPALNFGAPSAQAFADQAGVNTLLDPIIDAMIGNNITTQPDTAGVREELTNLVNGLNACGAGCSADRTAVIAKAVCASALGSAATVMQ